MKDVQNQADQSLSSRSEIHMAALIDTEHVSRIVAYLQGLLDQVDGLALYQTHQSDLEQVTPQSVLAAYYQLFAAGVPVQRLLGILKSDDKYIQLWNRSRNNSKCDIH